MPMFDFFFNFSFIFLFDFQIWRRCYETMPDCTQKQMLTYLEERYVGMSLKTKQRTTTKEILLKGSRVQFPSRPRCIGSKPMQYVQVCQLSVLILCKFFIFWGILSL